MITDYVLPGEDVFPEGITEDPGGVMFYVSSARQGTIFRGRTDAAGLEVWQPGGVDGRGQALGMAVDDANRLLVCGGETGYLFAYDTCAGQLLAQRTVPATPTLLNDVCVTGRAAYVTDSARPVVWRVPLDDGIGELEPFADLTRYGADPAAGHYLNGIVPALGGTILVVAAQGTGVLWRVDLMTGAAAPIDLNGALVSGDGLVFAGDLLYACDNTEEPDGAVRFWLTAIRLQPGADSGQLAGRWERPAADSPTTAAYIDGRLYLVNSQLLGDRDGSARPPFTVSALAPPA